MNVQVGMTSGKVWAFSDLTPAGLADLMDVVSRNTKFASITIAKTTLVVDHIEWVQEIPS
jgi:hypothetical protein